MNTAKKFELTNETMQMQTADGIITLHRIKALRNFNDIKAGCLGAWVEKEENLSHDGNAWASKGSKLYGNCRISENAEVIENGEVYGNAQVSGNAEIYGNAKVFDNAQVSGDAVVSGNAVICGNAKVYESGRVSQDGKVSGNVKVYGCGFVHGGLVQGNTNVFDEAEIFGSANVSDAQVYGRAKVHGYASIHGRDTAQIHGTADVCGDSVIYGNADIFSPAHSIVIDVGYIGNESRFITFYKDRDNDIFVVFHGSKKWKLKDFLIWVKKIHGESQYAKVYHAAVEIAQMQMDLSLKAPEDKIDCFGAR